MPTPVVSKICLAEDDLALVLGCDGLFEAFEGSCSWINKDVRAAVKKGHSADKIAKKLVKQALKDGSDDNVTCIIVLLNKHE